MIISRLAVFGRTRHTVHGRYQIMEALSFRAIKQNYRSGGTLYSHVLSMYLCGSTTNHERLMYLVCQSKDALRRSEHHLAARHSITDASKSPRSP